MAAHQDPDEDPGLAKERTRLSWLRTTIAFGALGVAMLRKDPATGLIVCAMTPLVWALGRFATAASRPEVLSRRLLLVTVTVAVVSVIALVSALLGPSPASLDQLLPRHG